MFVLRVFRYFIGICIYILKIDAIGRNTYRIMFECNTQFIYEYGFVVCICGIN